MSRCKADATGVNDPPPPPREYLIMFLVQHTYFYFIFFHSISTPYTYIFYTGSNTFRRRIRRILGGKGRGDGP